MKRNFIFILFVLLCVCTSISNLCCNGKRQIPKKTRIVAILCDLTTSIGDTSIHIVAQNAQDIIHRYVNKKRTQLSFIAIEPISLEAILQHTVKSPSVPSEEKPFAQEDSIASVQVKAKILDKYQYLKQIEGNKNIARSCILGGLEKTLNFFTQFNKADSSKGYEYCIYILSDMIEECSETPTGKELSFKKSKIDASLKIIQESKINFDLSLVDKIYVIPTSNLSYSNPDYTLSSSKLKEIWGKVFAKLGYNKEFYFDSNLPLNIE